MKDLSSVANNATRRNFFAFAKYAASHNMMLASQGRRPWGYFKQEEDMQLIASRVLPIIVAASTSGILFSATLM
jgi:hypothetical protein